MANRSLTQRLRDGACVAAAFAMVLYVTIAHHERLPPGSALALRDQAVVVAGRPRQPEPDDLRLASADSTPARSAGSRIP